VQLAAAQVLDDLNQVFRGAAQPVKPPDDDGVAGAGICQQLFPAGLVGLHARHRVGKDLRAAGLAQGVEVLHL